MHWIHCISRLCLVFPARLPSPNLNFSSVAVGGVHVCTGENQGLRPWSGAEGEGGFYSNVLRFTRACAHCLAKIAPNCYCDQTALVSPNDCKALVADLGMSLFHAGITHQSRWSSFPEQHLISWPLYGFQIVFWSTSWTACLLFPFYPSGRRILSFIFPLFFLYLRRVKPGCTDRQPTLATVSRVFSTPEGIFNNSSSKGKNNDPK